MTPRIYLPPERQTGTDTQLDPEQSQYLCQALRLRAGAALEVFDGRGARRAAQLETADRKGARIALLAPLPATPRPTVRITLVQGVASGDRMDWIIEKAVEAGATHVVPVLTERGDVRLDDQRARKRQQHWHRIAIAACRQSGRDDLPDIAAVSRLPAALTQLVPVAGHAWVLAPSADISLAGQLQQAGLTAQPGPAAVTLLVGPESGLSRAEIGLAQQHGFVAAGLGPRILRTETAGLVALTMVQTLLGDLR